MNILVLIQSYLPAQRHKEYIDVLKETIRSIRTQKLDPHHQVHIVLSDDGSDYLHKYASNAIQILPEQKLIEIKRIHNLDVDQIILAEPSPYYQKADLFNFYLESAGEAYECIVILDDDHAFVRDDAIARFASHFKAGYNFVAGRICNPSGYFRSYFDSTVQGANFALTYDLLKAVDFFGRRVKLWGCGEDSDIFWKVYNQALEREAKAIYDGNIITIDKLSGRWIFALQKAGGVKEFKAGFLSEYGVDPHDNPSRHKYKWMQYKPDDNRIRESLFPFIRFAEYHDFASHRLSIRFLITLYCIVLYNAGK